MVSQIKGDKPYKNQPYSCFWYTCTVLVSIVRCFNDFKICHNGRYFLSLGGYSSQILRKPTNNHPNSLSNPQPYREENTHQWYPMHGMNHSVYPPKYIQHTYTTPATGAPSKHNDTGYESQIDAR